MGVGMGKVAGMLFGVVWLAVLGLMLLAVYEATVRRLRRH
jgi:hypothetical protein